MTDQNGATKYIQVKGFDLNMLKHIPLPHLYNIEEGKKVVKRKSLKSVQIAYDGVVERDGAVCRRCGSVKDLTLDHIIPVSILRQIIGMDMHQKYDDLENLEILCRRCNLFKGNQIEMANPKAKILLKKYLEIA
jgi:5-methylcytosine-specific restriction endonuclease McrA